MKTKKITSIPLSIGMLVGAIIGGLGGVYLLGEIIFTVARILLGLSEEKLTIIIIPIIVLSILAIVGTLILVASIFVQHRVLQILIIVFSVAVPILGEIIDLTIRTFALYNELLQSNIVF